MADAKAFAEQLRVRGHRTRSAYAKAYPNVAREMAQAVARSNSLIPDHPAQAVAALQQHFSQLPAGILNLSMAAIAPAVPRNGRTTQAAWAKALTASEASGILKAPLGPKEGLLWTHRYLQGLDGESD